MDCCGHLHGSMHPAGMWSPALASVEAMLAGGIGPAGSTAAARTAEGASAALDVLRRSISIDVHTHGGRTGITSKAPPSSDLANAMRAGSLAVACLADVPDMPVLGRSAEGALAMVRAPATGELYATTSTGSPGWTCWLLITACVARSAPPIWRKRIERRSRR